MSSESDLPVRGVVPLDQMAGEGADELDFFRDAAAAAEKYLRSFPWCRDILETYFGDGVGGIVQVFFFRISPASPRVDAWLWVVVGDLPPAYFVIDQCRTPSETLEGYVQEMSKWVELAKVGRASSKVIPVDVAPTPENAKELEKRLQFLHDFVLPRFRDAETKRA